MRLPAVRDLLALPAQEGFVVLEAGDLGGGSSLRKLVEDAATRRSTALLPRRGGGPGRPGPWPCWPSTGCARAPTSPTYLESHLGGDRAVTRAEIAKLALYMADRPGAAVNLEDAAAIVGDSSALGVEDAVHAAVLGRRPELERALERLLAEGEAPVRLIRAAATLLLRLLRLSGGLAAGSVESVLASARPPIFFRHRPVFAASPAPLDARGAGGGLGDAAGGRDPLQERGLARRAPLPGGPGAARDAFPGHRAAKSG